MVGIHARNVPFGRANWTRMDDKSEMRFTVTGRSRGGQRSDECILGPEKLRRPENRLMYAIKCNSK